MNRINALALTRETPGAHYLLPSTIRGHSKQLAVYEPGNGLSPDTKSTSTMILDFQPLDLWKRNVCCLEAISLRCFCYTCPKGLRHWTKYVPWTFWLCKWDWVVGRQLRSTPGRLPSCRIWVGEPPTVPIQPSFPLPLAGWSSGWVGMIPQGGWVLKGDHPKKDTWRNNRHFSQNQAAWDFSLISYFYPSPSCPKT